MPLESENVARLAKLQVPIAAAVRNLHFREPARQHGFANGLGKDGGSRRSPGKQGVFARHGRKYQKMKESLLAEVGRNSQNWFRCLHKLQRERERHYIC